MTLCGFDDVGNARDSGRNCRPDRPDAAGLLTDLHSAGLTVWLDPDGLAVAPRERLTAELANRIRAQRDELVAVLGEKASYLLEDVFRKFGKSHADSLVAPCDSCGGLDQWQDAVGAWRCSLCDPHAGHGVRLLAARARILARQPVRVDHVEPPARCWNPDCPGDRYLLWAFRRHNRVWCSRCGIKREAVEVPDDDPDEVARRDSSLRPPPPCDFALVTPVQPGCNHTQLETWIRREDRVFCPGCGKFLGFMRD